MITLNDAWQRLLNTRGQIFRVTFITRGPQYGRNADGSRNSTIVAPAGRIRTMVCRRGVHKFTLGVIPPEVRFAEDVLHDCLTVFDIQFFNNLRIHLEDQGVSPGLANMIAGRRSYRRISMDAILSLEGA